VSKKKGGLSCPKTNTEQSSNKCMNFREKIRMIRVTTRITVKKMRTSPINPLEPKTQSSNIMNKAQITTMINTGGEADQRDPKTRKPLLNKPCSLKNLPLLNLKWH